MAINKNTTNTLKLLVEDYNQLITLISERLEKEKELLKKAKSDLKSIQKDAPLSTSAKEADKKKASPKKKAGRPKKVKDDNTQPKKKPGRPKKIKAENDVPKRKAGRPKKVKEENEELKKKLGRPKKVKSETVEPKRKPGRPKKVKSENDEPKRKPGRPKKVKSENDEPKRKPGRPKKRKIISVELSRKPGSVNNLAKKDAKAETKTDNPEKKEAVATLPLPEQKGRTAPKIVRKDFLHKLKQVTVLALEQLYSIEIKTDEVLLQDTRKEFEGNVTIVIFPYTKVAGKKPEEMGTELGEFLERGLPFVTGFNVIRGFLNLSIADSTWISCLKEMNEIENYGSMDSNGEVVVIEYCGPNTNKPLHIGHLRNMVLGYSMAEILKANGYETNKVNILNDRGLAISKSMWAYMKEGAGKTPQSEGVKGDHFVGDYYVRFGVLYKEEIAAMEANGMTTGEAEKNSKIMAEARDLLLKWEGKDLETRTLWARMNSWVYQGYEETYEKLGVDFERDYYESEVFEQGKEIVLQGLEDGVFEKDEDGSIFADLSEYKMDPKRILRSDGTSLYITQDLAVAEQRFEDYKMDRSIYVVADEQNLHFQQLQLILHKLGKDYSQGIHHLSYGMVHLPGNVRMRTREGVMVDTDDLIKEVISKASEATKESGKLNHLSDEEAEILYHKLGIAALKFFILTVNAKKKMTFDPAESVSLTGRSAIFIMFSFVRTQSVLRKFGKEIDKNFKLDAIEPIEQELIQSLYKFPYTIQEAADSYDPSLIANHTYEVAKSFNRFWTECQVLNNEDDNLNHFRMTLADMTGKVLKLGLNLLGIQTTDFM